MADTVALRAQLDGLRKVRASGTLKAEFNGRAVTYRSDAELVAAISDLERRIADAGNTRVRTVRINSSKGF